MVVFEGRVDNLDDLRRHLYVDRGADVAAVVLAGYRRWGEDAPSRMRGDFAFVVWDGAAQKVMAARDPFGIRPLHYGMANGQLVIASDVDQILDTGLVSTVPDDTMVVDFLLRRFRTLDRSFFRDIRRVPPGHVLIADAHSTRTSEYRAPPRAELAFSSTQECHEQFRSLFYTAVRRCLATPTPAVLELSGGSDSSAIVCVADRIVAEWPKPAPQILAASAVHPGLSCDETEFIDAVAGHVQLPVHKWDGTRATTLELEDPLLAAPGNRVSMSGGTEGHLALAREHHAGVLLGGLGGDQVGNSMMVPFDELARGHWRAGLRHLFPAHTPVREIRRRLVLTARTFSPPLLRRLRNALRRHRKPPLWLGREVRSGAHTEAPAIATEAPYLSFGQRLRWERLCEPAFAFAIEMKQRNTTASGVEARFPFLDWDLVMFALAVPFQHWPTGTLPRLHKAALVQDLPLRISNRKSKAEFTPALAGRLRAQVSGIHDLFAGSSWAAQRFVDQAAARRLLEEFRRSETSQPLDTRATYHLWAIASVEAWLRGVLRYSSRPGLGETT